MGRLPTYDRSVIVPAICKRLAAGEPLVAICREDGMPDVSTVWDWEKADESIAQAIACAREVGGDAIAAEALAIADEREEDPASRRVMVETRLKLLAKWHPKRYGDKLGLVGGDGQGPVQVQPVQVAFVARLPAPEGGE